MKSKPDSKISKSAPAKPEPAPAPIAPDTTAFIRGMFADLSPMPSESGAGSNITSAVLTDYERACAEHIAGLMGERGSLSIVLKVALRRLIIEGIDAGAFGK